MRRVGVSERQFEELIERIKQGDLEAENELFEAFKVFDRVQVMINARVQAAKEDKNDLIAEVLQALVLGLRNGRYEPSRGPFGSYLWGIARNKIRDYFRRCKNQKTSSLLEEPVAKLHTDGGIYQEEKSALIQMKVDSLEDKYREVVKMKYFEELPVSEIALRLNLIPKQVYNRLNYSIRLLRNAY